MAVKFEKALRCLDLLLEGKLGPKQIAHKVGIHERCITDVREMFPLFTGFMARGPNKKVYTRRKAQES